MAATFTVPENVREILSRSVITENSVKLPPGQLPRPVYDAVNKVLVAAGGKWHKQSGSHQFTRDPRQSLGLAVSDGKAVNVQQQLQAFYTPKELAARMAELTVKAGDRVLEPSAGTGALTDEALEQGASIVHCYDIDEHAITVLRDKYKSHKNTVISQQDFLTVDPGQLGQFDSILMNPPFTKGQDREHISHALKFLKPGGRLAAICSPGILTGTSKAARAFQDRITELGGHFEDIPAGTFKKSGTPIATLLLTVTAP